MFVDFDGTIASLDTTDALLERFALPEWVDIEADWKAGRIGSRECMVRQIALVRATPQEYDRFLDQIPFDPSFPAFVAQCRRLGMPVTVVSDGLDRHVWRVLARAGVGDIAIRANRLEWLGEDRWRIAFPHSRSDCSQLSGNCKCQFPDAVAAFPSVMIGDGRSDFCVSARVDLVIAKGALVAHCKAQGLPYVAFDSFATASDILARWATDEAHIDTQAGISPATIGDE